MDIYFFAEAMGLDIIIIRHHGQNGRHTAHFPGWEIKDDALFMSAYGNGKSATDSVYDYARKISDKTIVINATGKDRKEIKVPRLDELGGY